MAIRKFDEVNNYQRKISGSSDTYEEYFSAMRLPDDEIDKRITTARKLENLILPILSMVAANYAVNQYVDRENLVQKLYDAYVEVGNDRIPNSDYLYSRAEEFAQEVSDTTVKHLGNVYYTSLDRTELIAKTESNVIHQEGQFEEAEASGKVYKRWVAIIDSRTRESHFEMDGEVVGLFDYFIVNGYKMLHPGDTESDDVPADEIVNCRCSVEYLTSAEDVDIDEL